MLHTSSDKATMTQITDQAFRSKGAARTVDQFAHILNVQGIPRFFSPIDRALLRGFQTFGGWLPGVAVPLVKGRSRAKRRMSFCPRSSTCSPRTSRIGEAEGVRMNVNFLGEALLGEGEAKRRLERSGHEEISQRSPRPRRAAPHRGSSRSSARPPPARSARCGVSSSNSAAERHSPFPLCRADLFTSGTATPGSQPPKV